LNDLITRQEDFLDFEILDFDTKQKLFTLIFLEQFSNDSLLIIFIQATQE